jgi:hypothetical protein
VRLKFSVVQGPPTDPVTFTLAFFGIAAITFAASYIPAPKAASVDPITSLRTEQSVTRRLHSFESDRDSAGNHQSAAESLAPREFLAKKQRSKNDYQRDTQFIDGCDAGGRTNLKRPKVAQP